MTVSRRKARRQALFLLYQWDLSGQEIGSPVSVQIGGGESFQSRGVLTFESGEAR